MKFSVDIVGVWKTYTFGWPRRKMKEALKNITLAVPEGVIWGVLGPNGAGKTTLLSILSNLVTAEKGRIIVLGEDIRTRSSAIRHRINLSSGHANFPWSMTVRENLLYYAMLYGLHGKKRDMKVGELLDLFELRDFIKVPFDGLSTGTKQKLSLAKSLLNDPELLFLDEPTVGLDPDVVRRVWESIRQIHHNRGTTILMSTHNMKEAEKLCEKIVFIKGGMIRAFGRPSDLKEDLRLGDRISLLFQGRIDPENVRSLSGIYEVIMENETCHVMVDDHKKRLPDILDLFVNQGAAIRNLNISEADLEDVFITLAK